ncbi:hypothetical protein NHX12_031428, partial [Muraenolepis orangiensis]
PKTEWPLRDDTPLGSDRRASDALAEVRALPVQNQALSCTRSEVHSSGPVARHCSLATRAHPPLTDTPSYHP